MKSRGGKPGLHSSKQKPRKKKSQPTYYFETN